MNVLKPNLRISVHTLLDAGKSQREIERVLGVDRKTIRRIQQQSKSPVTQKVTQEFFGSFGPDETRLPVAIETLAPR